MRVLALCFGLALVGCSTSDAISPDSARDGGTTSDAGTRADGGVGDGGLTEGGLPGPGDTVSGTRLKARYQNGDDGSKSFVGWYDSARSENCGFVTASDGTQRCEPQGPFALVGYFSDPGCSMPIAVAFTAGCTPKYAEGSASIGTCTSGLRVYSITSPAASGYAGSPGSCFQITTAGYTFYNYSATEIAPSSFVQGTESHE